MAIEPIVKIEVVPRTRLEKVKLIGPGLVWATAAIGSGELIISAKVGAEFGYAFIWALWVGVWFKYWIHKGILDLTILTGQPVVALWDNLKGGKVFSIYWLLFFILTMTGVSGLLGLTASALHVLLPFVSVNIWATLIVLSIILLAYFQNYDGFEKLMLTICLILIVGAAGAVFLSRPQVTSMFAWDIPTTTAATLIFLSLLGWGAGSGPDLMIPYSWWVTEKGYHNLQVGAGDRALVHETEANSVHQVKQWLNVTRWDTIAGYVLTGLIASAFMITGATILQPRGIVVGGLDVLTNVSTIFTGIYGAWTFWFFMVAAFAALFSTTLGVFDGGRIVIAYLARLLLGQEPIQTRHMRANAGYRTSLIVFSIIPLIIFFWVQKPVLLVIIAGVLSAVSMPVLAGLVLWSLTKQIPSVYRPSKFYCINLGLGIVIYLYFTIQTLLKL